MKVSACQDPRVLASGGSKIQLTVYSIVVRRVTNDRVTTARSESVLAVDLILSTIYSVGASPDVNVRLSVVPVGGALLLHY